MFDTMHATASYSHAMNRKEILHMLNGVTPLNCIMRSNPPENAIVWNCKRKPRSVMLTVTRQGTFTLSTCVEGWVVQQKTNITSEQLQAAVVDYLQD